MSTNFDQAEVNKFDALASRWWDKTSEFKPLHDINPLRVEYITQRFDVAGKSVLDVGCGGGILSEALAKAGAKVTGIDAGEGPIEVAKMHLFESELDVDYQQCLAETWAAQHPERYDAVCCLEMLEHVPDPASVIQACADLVKPGGHLFFSTINRNPKSYALTILAAEYLLNMVPKGTHDYSKYIKPSELATWLRQANLQLVETSGMSFNPLSRDFRISSDVDANYLMYVRKPN